MLTKLLIAGAFILIGVVIYFIVRAVMNRGMKPDATTKPPVDIVDRSQSPSPTGHKYETPDERIARIEEELRRLDDEDDTPPTSGS